MAFIVNSSKLMVWSCSFSNVFKEVIERFSPSFAYSNAAPTVSRIPVYGFVVASALHIYPRKPLFSFMAFLSLPMFKVHNHIMA